MQKYLTTKQTIQPNSGAGTAIPMILLFAAVIVALILTGGLDK